MQRSGAHSPTALISSDFKICPIAKIFQISGNPNKFTLESSATHEFSTPPATTKCFS